MLKLTNIFRCVWKVFLFISIHSHTQWAFSCFTFFRLPVCSIQTFLAKCCDDLFCYVKWLLNVNAVENWSESRCAKFHRKHLNKSLKGAASTFLSTILILKVKQSKIFHNQHIFNCLFHGTARILRVARLRGSRRVSGLSLWSLFA